MLVITVLILAYGPGNCRQHWVVALNVVINHIDGIRGHVR